MKAIMKLNIAARRSRIALLLRARPAALSTLVSLAAAMAMPAHACTFANLVVPIGQYFEARLPTGETVSNNNPFGCHGFLPLIVEYGATLNNRASFSNDLGVNDGPNGRGGLLVGGLFDNKAGATVINSGEFYVGRPVDLRGVLRNAGRFVNTRLLDVSGLLDNSGGLNNEGTLTLTGGLTNSGKLYNTGTLNTLGALANTGTLTNEGTLQFSRSPGLFPPRFSNAGGVLENRLGGTLNFTNVNLGSDAWAGGTLNNNGTLRGVALIAGDADSGIVNLLADGTVENSSLTVVSGYTQSNDGRLINTSVYVNGGTFVNNGLIWGRSGIDISYLDNATLRNSNTGQIEVNESTLRNHGRLANTGYVIVRSGGRIDNGFTSSFDYGNTGHLQNDGVLSVDKMGVINNVSTINSTVTLYNAGLIDNQGPLSHLSNSGRFDNVGTFTSPAALINTGTIVNTGDFRVDGSFSLGGVFFNSGQVIFGADSITTGTGRYQQTAGATRVDGSIDIRTFNLTGGSLCGSGTINGSVVVRNGTVCPGNSPGTLHIGGNLGLFNSTLEIEIAGTAPGTFDVLQVDGSATFGGSTLKLSFADGYLPPVGAHWAFVDSPNAIAGLGSLRVEVSGLPIGYVAAISAGGQLTFSSTPVPEPGSLVLMAAGMSCIIWLRLRRSGKADGRPHAA